MARAMLVGRSEAMPPREDSMLMRDDGKGA